VDLTLSKFGFRSTFLHSVNVNVYFLVVKANSTGNCNAFRSWISIPPNIILIFLTFDDNAIVVCIPFVRTGGNRFGGFKEVEIDARLWKVVADRESSLIKKKRGR